LCLGGAIKPIISISSNLLYAKGKPEIVLYMTIIIYILTAIGIVIGLNWGIIGVVISFVFVRMLMFLINFAVLEKLHIYKIKNLFHDVVPYIILSTIIGIAVYYIGMIFETTHLFKIIMQIFLGIFIYILTSKLLKMDAFMHARQLIYCYLLLRTN
jgi:O-antigen/teichoic acid export membrane protein